MTERSIAHRHPYPLRSTLTGFLLFSVVAGAGAQALTNAQRDAAEQRRIQERDAQLREQQEKSSDVRLKPAAQNEQILPASESPCFPIRQLELRGEAAA